jgi:hypothetical protein
MEFSIATKVTDDLVKELIISSPPNESAYSSSHFLALDIVFKERGIERVMLSINEAEELANSIRMMSDMLLYLQGKRLSIKTN